MSENQKPYKKSCVEFLPYLFNSTLFSETALVSLILPMKLFSLALLDSSRGGKIFWLFRGERRLPLYVSIFPLVSSSLVIALVWSVLRFIRFKIKLCFRFRFL